LKHTTETLYKDIKITGDVRVYGDVLVSGFVNGLDLSEFTLDSPEIDDKVEETKNALTATLKRQCSSLNFITEALAG